MTGTIAIIAALPAELKPLVSPVSGVRWQRLKTPKGTVLWTRTHANGQWIAGCAGMGGERATVALQAMERYARIDAICSVGWAGALDRQISAASVWHIAEVIDTQTGERFSTALKASGRTEQWPLLATSPQVADAAEKARLASSYGARLVDMEAATLARIAQARGIPFFCLKAVSDDADANLPNLNPYISNRGQLRLMPFMAHVALRPGSWRAMMQLGRYSAIAAQHLAKAVQLWLDEPDSRDPAASTILEPLQGGED